MNYDSAAQLVAGLIIATFVLCLAAVVLGVVNMLRLARLQTGEMERRLLEEMRGTRKESAEGVRAAVQDAANTQAETQRQLDERQDKRLRELREQLAQSQEGLQRSVMGQLRGLDERFAQFSQHNEQKLENVRATMEQRVAAMQAGNEKKLEEMRLTVDEKLQKTLDERLKQSFSLVNESLDKVQRGLGEMQNLANGVGDLKKVLSNVKTRGILGEIQLGAILEEILAPEQYAANVATVPGSAERVEYAVKLPGDGAGETIWLPIDAKFPSDAYARLLEAYEAADPAAVDAAAKTLEGRIRLFAKDIRDKYIGVPHTTEFGVMFLPVEGLYAEVVRLGLVEKLQNEYKVNIAGPTTMAALLSSLQMGFRTLAIQKHSGEVWKVLGEVKSEFAKFGDVLTKTKRHLEYVNKDIDDLLGTRTNQMQRKLNGVTTIAGTAPQDALPQALDAEDDAQSGEEAEL